MMATPDGINSLDWDEVKSLASDIVNTSGIDADTSSCKNALINYLVKLETIYGRLPSIVSTMAEYTDDLNIALTLLKEAYSSACEIGDDFNKTLISSSIAEQYIEENIAMDKVCFWLGEFEKNRRQSTDDYFEELWVELNQNIS